MRVRWNSLGKFEYENGKTFVPYGGVYANFLEIHKAGIRPDRKRLDQGKADWYAQGILEFSAATDDELRQWLGYLKKEGMNFTRMFCRGEMRPTQDPLDIGGKVNPGLWGKIKHYLDLHAQMGMHVHFVACQEPRCSVYMGEEVLRERALPHYGPGEMATLAPHCRRWLDPKTPRATYENYFTDPDVLKCHLDYLTDLAKHLKDHPALLSLEIYNESQWGSFHWNVHDQELAWSKAIIEHMHKVFPGVPACMSIAGFGIAAHDGLLWSERVPMDFFSPHAYPLLAGVSARADFAMLTDAILNYTQTERPTFMGEWDPGTFPTDEPARLLTRDVAWLSVLSNCPGFGMWMCRGYGEFELARQIMEGIDFAHFKPKEPMLTVDISQQAAFFHGIEKKPGECCHLPEDVWCPHRDSDKVHRYCVKMQSEELQDIFNFARFALIRGVSYRFTRHPRKFASTWKLEHIGTHHLEKIRRPLVPTERCAQLKYLSAADDSVHVAYVRNGLPCGFNHQAGRCKGPAHPVTIDTDLDGGLEYELEIWNLDTHQCEKRTVAAKGRIDLGVTADDFALVFRKH
ncbi:MAG: hypothetical protein IT443_01170 [Phycisphaeraceae bacterium]|nr:hypothetical protein [Phycisphaeraceae bacterium]